MPHDSFFAQAFDYGTFSVYFPPSLIRLVLNYILNYDETCYTTEWFYIHILSRVRFPALIFITFKVDDIKL